MSNLLQDFASNFNFETKGTQAWGDVEGYWFQVAMPQSGSNSLKIRTAVFFPDEAVVTAVANDLADFVQQNPSVSYDRKGGTFRVSVKKPFGGYNTQVIEGLLLKMVSIFRKAGASPACFNCNSEHLDSFAMVNGTAMKLCAQCQASIAGTIEKRTQEYAAVKSNYLLGIIGAVIGALLGSLVWILIGYLGFFAAIGGVAIAFCAIMGYQLMKGKVTKPAVLMICLISIVVMIFAQFITTDILVLKDIPGSDFGSVFKRMLELLFVDSVFTSAFVKDCLLGLLFLALGSWSLFRRMGFKAQAPAGKFQRL